MSKTRVGHAAGTLAVLTATLLLGGCSGGSLNTFDPTDLLDFLHTEKKLPGERRAVFPEGVPGVEPGVPREMIRGNDTAAAPAASQAEAERAPPAAASPAPAKPRRSAAASPRRRAAPPPPPAERAPADAAEPEPAAEEQDGQPSSFPAPLPSGSFQR